MDAVLRLFLSLSALAFFTLPLPAQPTNVHPPGAPAQAFTPLSLPPPTTYRTGSGTPGPDYWQQRVDYRIAARLDPATHRLAGTVTITYTNHAPHALDYLWLQLDQNLFATDSRGALVQPAEARWSGSFEEGGYDLTRVEIVRGDARLAPPYLIDDTRLRLTLDEPLPPGGAVLDIEIDYAFTVPEYGADRMGRLDVAQGMVYEIAQWYPRLHVYDEVHGWNALPYLGQGEFYLEYGAFDVEITVPSDFVVVATGELRNEADVWTDAQQQRFAEARRSAETIPIIAAKDVGTEAARPGTRAFQTWIFHAENVRDFAWAASQAFIVDAAGWEGTLLMSAYPREGLGTGGQQGWEASTQYMRHAVQHYSERWFRYPYPVAVNVAGIVGGMEYPGIVFCSVQARDQDLFGVTDHELGHTWFPMIVGNDERRHAWMDEGFNTFLNYYSNLAFYGDEASRNARLAPAAIAQRMQEPIADQPSATYPDRIRPDGLGFLAYRKPGAGLRLLREYILGPDRFDPAFREYIQRWAFKHPQPADFFRTIEDVAGEDLDWFWRGWFFGTDKLDQAVGNVAAQEEGTLLEITHLEPLFMPVALELRYTDGTSERRRIPVEAFVFEPTYRMHLNRRDLDQVILDPDEMLPDVDRRNNTWQRGDTRVLPEPKG